MLLSSMSKSKKKENHICVRKLQKLHLQQQKEKWQKNAIAQVEALVMTFEALINSKNQGVTVA